MTSYKGIPRILDCPKLADGITLFTSISRTCPRLDGEVFPGTAKFSLVQGCILVETTLLEPIYWSTEVLDFTSKYA